MLIDNKVDRYPEEGLGIKTVWDFINLYSGQSSGQIGKLDIVTGYFTIRALSKLYRELPEQDEFRIVSSEMVREEQQLEDIKDLLNGDFTVDTALQLDQYAKEAKAFLERNTVQIRAIANAFCHAKVYMFKNNIARNNGYYLTGSSNLTDAGLGLKPTSNIELTIGDSVNKANPDYKEVCHWFEDIWKTAKEKIQDPANPTAGLISVKDYFIRMIEEYFRKYTPEEIYYKILFEIFKGGCYSIFRSNRNKDVAEHSLFRAFTAIGIYCCPHFLPEFCICFRSFHELPDSFVHLFLLASAI